MKLPAVLCALLLSSALPAQLVVRRAVSAPYAVDEGARMRHGEPRPPTVSGHPRGTGAAASSVAQRYWYWNRAVYLPRPTARTAPGFEAPGSSNTGGVSGPRAWLFERTRSSAVEERAQALFALGCAGPGADGLALLTAALTDPAARVRHAALLALGEHGGTKARFRLIRELADVDRPRRHRRLAALAYGVACAVDGGEGGRGLRRFCDDAVGVDDRAAACAADALSGGLALSAAAREWLAAYRPARSAELPGLALDLALSGLPRDAANGRLRPLLQTAEPPLRLAARAGALRHGRVTAADLRVWLATPAHELRDLTVFAAVGHVGLPQLAKAGFQRPTLRGVAALALAVHARQAGHPPVRAELRAAARNQRSFAERPLWVLAFALVGDAAATPRARASLHDKRTPVAVRVAASDALALATSGDRSSLRAAVHLDPASSVRLVAADGIARHAQDADVQTLVHAVAHAADATERAAMLIALGRSRHVDALPVLMRWCADAAASAELRRGSWYGLALYLRHSGESPLARLPRDVAFAHLPDWLVDLVAH